MTELVHRLLDGQLLDEPEAADLLLQLVSGETHPGVVGAVLASLRVRGETADEVRGFVKGLYQLATPSGISDVSNAVDIVGTGGDSSGSFNLSTGAALVASAAGVGVVKHGNRAVSSKSGSFDVLKALGLDLPMEPERAARLYERTGFTFLHAPTYHPAVGQVGPVRSALAARTIFNLVGPLANPARVRRLVVGAFSLEVAAMMADTLAGMDIDRAFVVHGGNGWDEPTPVGPYHLFEIESGHVQRSIEDPQDFGLSRCVEADLIGGDPDHNAQAMRRVLEGETGPHRDSLILGASLALRLFGTDSEEALNTATSAIESGAAAVALDEILKVDG